MVDEYKANERFDVIFLDIEMPGLSGLEAGQEIRKIDVDTIIIFLTSHDQFVFQSFKIEAFDYLIKPIDIHAANDALARATKKYQSQHFIVSVKWKNEEYRLEVNDIVYINGYGRHVIFHTKKDEFEIVGKLSDYETMLAPYGFVRSHMNDIINMKYIESIGEKTIETTTGHKILMSARKKQKCLKSFNEYLARRQI